MDWCRYRLEHLPGDTDSVEDRGKVVRHETVATALREDSSGDDQEAPLTVSWCPDKLIPSA